LPRIKHFKKVGCRFPSDKNNWKQNVAIQVNKVGQVLEEQIKRCENRGKSGQKEFSMEGKELLIPYSDFCIKTRNIKTSQKV
jgi:hypothetical protein